MTSVALEAASTPTPTPVFSPEHHKGHDHSLTLKIPLKSPAPVLGSHVVLSHWYRSQRKDEGGSAPGSQNQIALGHYTHNDSP